MYISPYPKLTKQNLIINRMHNAYENIAMNMPGLQMKHEA